VRQRTPLTTRRLRRWYRTYNRRYFNGELPPNIPLKLVEDRDHRGYVLGEKRESCTIAINEAYYWDTGIGRMTLLHEMVHVKLCPYPNHGPRFQEEMQRLAASGAFRRLW
jgi:hypothetical protein